MVFITKKILAGIFVTATLTCTAFGGMSACVPIGRVCTTGSSPGCCGSAGFQASCKMYLNIAGIYFCSAPKTFKPGQHWVGSYNAPSDPTMTSKQIMDITVGTECFTGDIFTGSIYHFNHSKKISEPLSQGVIGGVSVNPAFVGAPTGAFRFYLPDKPSLGVVKCTYQTAHSGATTVNISCLGGMITANLHLQSK